MERTNAWMVLPNFLDSYFFRYKYAEIVYTHNNLKVCSSEFYFVT